MPGITIIVHKRTIGLVPVPVPVTMTRHSQQAHFQCSGSPCCLWHRFSKDLKKRKLVEADYQQSGAWVMHGGLEGGASHDLLLP